MANKKNLVLALVVVFNIVFFVILGVLSYRVYQSFDIEGLDDPRAFPAIENIQNIYDVLVPFALVWGVILAVVSFVFSKRSLIYKIAMPLLLVIIGGSLYLNITGFNTLVEDMLATEGKFEQLYAAVPSEEPVIDYENTDPAVLELLGSSETISGLQNEIISDYFDIIEASAFNYLEVSVIITLAYLSTTAGMSMFLVKDTSDKKKQ
ncbi:MAG: hypothetical protein US52_C0028G0005 [candidate division WS6 bacterium GW2011_GWA2_37_6]|uniref:Uncharacterized protein n=1 Tax=candidate division WS6 bacterium GW2011_GWA2_37_6 TaxID=1619087 RepID=A0A0G0GZ88_9BACT|nr:MAG: hypothetical protein US52_C0028G0005 [candidate division WS6 bacterium GW2011_GWA2_37_6]